MDDFPAIPALINILKAQEIQNQLQDDLKQMSCEIEGIRDTIYATIMNTDEYAEVASDIETRARRCLKIINKHQGVHEASSKEES